MLRPREAIQWAMSSGFVRSCRSITGSHQGRLWAEEHLRPDSSWTLSRTITASLGYRFIDRNADQGSYRQNRVDFGLAMRLGFSVWLSPSRLKSRNDVESISDSDVYS